MYNSLKLKLLNNNYVGQIIAIFFIQASSTIAFAVFFSGLSIYLTKYKLVTQDSAIAITGLFLSLNYSLPLFGGLIANRIIAYKKLYLLGTTFSLVACLVLAFTGAIYFALALFLMNSLASICLNIFLTQLFTKEQVSERRAAFMWNYIGMNLGFMLGFLLTGFSTISNNYYYLFITMSFFLLIALILTCLFIKEPKLDNVINKSNKFQLISALGVFSILIILIYFLFKNAALLQNYITFFALSISAFLMCYGFNKHEIHEKKKFIKFASFSFLSVVFWTFYMLTPIAMMQLIEKGVKRIAFGVEVAPQWLMNIDGMIILIIAPMLNVLIKRNKKYFDNTYNYFVLGFLFPLFGFLILGIGVTCSYSSYISLNYVICYLILMTVGEIFISPASNALIGELITEPLRGIMTGAWGMNICIGGLLASFIAKKFILVDINNSGIVSSNNIHLSNVFFIISSILFALVVFISIKIYNETKYSLKQAYASS